MASTPVTSSPAPEVPARYVEVLNRRRAELERVMVNSASEARGAKFGLITDLLKNTRMLLLLGAGLLVGVVGALGSPSKTGPGSRTPFSRTQAVSAAGLGVSGVMEFLPPGPAEPPAASQTTITAQEATGLVDERFTTKPAPPAPPSPPPATALGSAVPRPRPAPAQQDEAAEERRRRRRALPSAQPVVLIAEDDSATSAMSGIEVKPLLAPPPSAPPAATTVNLGSRFRVVLEGPIRTDAATVPVTATVATDVTVRDTAVIRAGSRLAGQAIAVRDNDRIQILFTALIQDGVTMPIQALAMVEDGQMGIPAKVVKKASGGKSVASKVLSAVGGAASAASFGLIPTGGDVGDRVAAEMARDAAQQAAADVENTARRWSAQRSDKVLTARAGVPFHVYLEADFKLAAAR